MRACNLPDGFQDLFSPRRITFFNLMVLKVTSALLGLFTALNSSRSTTGGNLAAPIEIAC